MSRCKVSGCGARAWHGNLCSYHALKQIQEARQVGANAKRGKSGVHRDAQRLGLALSEPRPALAAARSTKRVRSPVG